MQIGLRESNQQFSQLMKAVRDGREVLLTDRGKPFAVVRPVRGVAEADSTIQRLEAAGFLRPAEKRGILPTWNHKPVKGLPLAKTIRNERDER